MKMHRTTIIASVLVPLLFAAAPRAHAQTGINSTVEVERDYEGSIARAVKYPVDAPVEDSLLNFKLDFDYTTFYSPYKDLYEFAPMMTLGPASEGRTVYPWLYAVLAAAWPLTPSAELAVTPRLGDRFSLGFYAAHDSFWGNVPQVGTAGAGGRPVLTGETVSGDRMKNRAGAAFGYRWRKGELKLGASYSGSMYALAPVEDFSSYRALNTFDHVRAGLSVRSANPDPDAFYYDLNVDYRYFNDRQYIAEHLADAEVSLGATVRREHKVYLRFAGTFSDYGVWKISPMYRWAGDRWRIKAGVTFSSAYGGRISDGNQGIVSNSNRFLIHPDASVTFEAARNALWLYMKAYGDNRLYTLYELFSINPWMDHSDIPHLSSTPIAAELGLRGQVRDRFSYSIGANYSYVRNMLAFMSMQQGQSVYQSPAGGESHVFTASGALRWKSRDFLASAEFSYRAFSDPDAALMMPAFDLSAVLEYNLRQRLFIRADCYFRTSAVGEYMGAGASVPVRYDVPAFVDLGLRISYAFNMHVTAFVEGNNLANNKIQYFLNYLEPGINIGAGICLRF